MSSEKPAGIVTLDPRVELWESCFIPAPLVLIGSREPDGVDNFAPKHMATPLGHESYFGFVCRPSHRTYRNIEDRGEFTVTFPRPDQILLASLAAAPREEDDSKPALQALATFPAQEVGGAFLEQGYLFLECRLERLVEGFGEDCLVVGWVVRAHVHGEVLRSAERDDQELICRSPLLAYLHPGRFATVGESFSFPYPLGFKL